MQSRRAALAVAACLWACGATALGCGAAEGGAQVPDGPGMSGAPEPAPFSAVAPASSNAALLAALPEIAIEEDAPDPDDARPVDAVWLGGSPSHMVIANRMGEATYLGLWVDVPEPPPTASRAPVAVALVVDASGSMQGGKIEEAREAAARMIGSLAPRDWASVHAFSDSVAEIAPLTQIDASSPRDLIRRVGHMDAAGETNMFAGLRAGVLGVAGAKAAGLVRHVIVISDGRASMGPQSPAELGRVAAWAASAGIQMSAVGVGADYDEETLGALALRGGGRLYDLQDPSELAAILEREVRLVQRTIATGAYVEIEPSDGVELLGSEFVPSTMHGDRLRIELGSLVPGQPRQALVRMRVRGAPAEDKELAKARLVYRPAREDAGWAVQTISLRATVGTDWQLAEMCKHPGLRAMVARYLGAQARVLAAEMMRHGEKVQPATMLEAAEVVLGDAARAIPPSPDRERLQSQAADIREASARVRQATSGELRGEAKEAYAKAFGDVGLSPPQAPSIPASPSRATSSY